MAVHIPPAEEVVAVHRRSAGAHNTRREVVVAGVVLAPTSPRVRGDHVPRAVVVREDDANQEGREALRPKAEGRPERRMSNRRWRAR